MTTATSVHLADVATGREWFSTASLANAFSADGRRLAVAVPGQTKMTELADGSYRGSNPLSDAIDVVDLSTLERRRIAIRGESIGALALSADAELVAVAVRAIDPLIRVYRVDDGSESGVVCLPRGGRGRERPFVFI